MTAGRRDLTPLAIVELMHAGRFGWHVRARCPFCARLHQHGAGSKHSPPDLSYRAADCGAGPYLLVTPDSAARRRRRALTRKEAMMNEQHDPMTRAIAAAAAERSSQPRRLMTAAQLRLVDTMRDQLCGVFIPAREIRDSAGNIVDVEPPIIGRAFGARPRISDAERRRLGVPDPDRDDAA